jgi:aerobic-type carbon monoxide dehydrogenase small subunit (CoxS/CutS family)
VRFTLNGVGVAVRAHPLRRLLDLLREDLGLTGTKAGCEEGECGACTVLVNGAPVDACLVPVAHVAGARVTTIEGFARASGRAGRRRRLQEAFVAEGGTQCGICTPGVLLAAAALPARPGREAVRRGLAGNLCRCTGYEGILRAVAAALGGPRSGRAPTGRRPGAARGAPGAAPRRGARSRRGRP